MSLTLDNEIPTANITLNNKKIPTYDLKITKIEKGDDTKLLEGAKFKLYKETKEMGTYTTDENGNILIEGLYLFEEERNINQTYILKEIFAPEGYAKVGDITFFAQEQEGTIVLVSEQATNYTVEESTINLTIEDSPSFKLIKKDGETGELLPNVKYAIYDIENEEKPARNSKGEIIGTKEIINGEEYYTIVTNENGEIKADLPEGLYKAVEIEAPEKYDITGKTEYFGIGKSRETEAEGQEPQIIRAQSLGIPYTPRNINKWISITQTSNGGYAIGGGFSNNNIIVKNDVNLSSNGNVDGFIIKYDEDGEVKWAKAIGGSSDDSIFAITGTKDGGILVGGEFASSNIDLENGVTLNSNGIIKYNEDGEVEWAKTIGGKSYIADITISDDNGFVVIGENRGNLNLGNGVNLTNNTNSDYYFIIKYDEDGEVEWAKTIEVGWIFNIIKTDDSGYIILGQLQAYDGNIDVGNGITLSSNGRDDGIIIKYDVNGNVEWAKVIGGESNDFFWIMAETSDGGIVVGGTFESSNLDLGNGVNVNSTGEQTGVIIKYNEEGEAEWAKVIGNIDEIKEIMQTNDNGFLIAGYGEINIDIGNGLNLSSTGDYNYITGFIIKYNEYGEAEWGKGIGNSIFCDCIQKSDDSYIAVGFTEGENDIYLENGEDYSYEGYFYGGMILEIAIPKSSSEDPDIPEVSEIIVENIRKTFKITTDVEEIDNVKGGSISGEDIAEYETVKYGDSSVKEIKMTPDENYEIIAITINGEEYEFTQEADGTYTMPQFTNITEDKHVVVTYSLKANKVVINKVDKDTREPLKNVEFEITEIEDYTGRENMYSTRAITNNNGQIITQLPFGKYEIKEIEAPDGYEQIAEPVVIDFVENGTREFTIENTKLATVTVHHYIKGTTTKVAEDEIYTGKAGEEYRTAPQLDIQGYELEKNEQGSYIIPGNAIGEFTFVPQEVIYYYEEKEILLTVHHYLEGTILNVPLADGSYAEDEYYSGKEGEEYTTNSLENILDRYELVERPENADGIYEADEIVVTYYYKEKVLKITTKVLGDGGSISGQDEDIYEEVNYEEDSTKDIIIVPEEKYFIKAITINGEEYEFTEEADGTYTMPQFTNMTEDKEVVVVFEKMPTQVVVHHYIENTTEKLSEDVIITGKIDDEYSTEVAEDISRRYELVSEPENKEGIMTQEPIEVIYYYKLRDIVLQFTSNIEKTGDTTITNTNSNVSYEINYNATIQDFIGKATLTIVDTLPYKIEETESDIAGGVYDADTNTIIWEEEILDIDTLNDGDKLINKTKTLSLKYIFPEDLSEIVSPITNNVSGTIRLENMNDLGEYNLAGEETKEDDHDIVFEIPSVEDEETIIEKQVQKVWEDNNNIRGNRPESVKIQLTANGNDTLNGEKLESVILSEDNDWKYTFMNLQKYDENETEIVYSVIEEEVNSGDLEDYNEADITVGTSIIVTNTYKMKDIVINSNITKDGTDKISNTKDEVSYKIEYNATIEDYIGSVVLTITDRLPNKIDVTKSDLADGIYNEDMLTITWTEEIEDINTEINGDFVINKTKEINVVYEDIDLTQKYIRNNVKGKLEFIDRDEKDEVEALFDTEIDVKGEVIVKYLDIETNKELKKQEIIKGKEGENYTTTRKVIENYQKTGKDPDNAKGVITKEQIVVTYYYKKLPFNIKVEKEISEILVNEKQMKITNGKLMKVEVVGNKAKSTGIIIKYKIKVTNDGQIAGTANIVDIIPEKFEIAGTNPKYWSKENGKISTKVELKPGETKELEVVLKWNNKDFGIMNNKAELEQVENSAGFDETNVQDNMDNAEVVIAVKTGLNKRQQYIILAVILAILIAGRILVKKLILEEK